MSTEHLCFIMAKTSVCYLTDVFAYCIRVGCLCVCLPIGYVHVFIFTRMHTYLYKNYTYAIWYTIISALF